MSIRDIQFELRAYPADEHGKFTTERPTVSLFSGEKTSAHGKAGRLSKKINGPVDLAYAGDEPWADRYITTAAPSEHHVRGYRFERLAD